jgi:hypothetical protein
MTTETVVITPDLQSDLSIRTQSLGGPGSISTQSAIDAAGNINTLNQLRTQMVDYIRLRLGDQIVDVELDKEHYDLAIKQALVKYRQRSPNAVEESYAFLDLLPEVQEYILPNYIMEVRQIFRRGIGSTSGTTASQFEPFASGYLNTYMLVAGRVGGLTNYELFAQYQELAMTMFGGYMNFTWNRVTKKITLVRKIPDSGNSYLSVASITSNGTATGSIITITLNQPANTIQVSDSLYINNCNVTGYSGQYRILTIGGLGTVFTVQAMQVLGATSVTGIDLQRTNTWCPTSQGNGNNVYESILLWIYNYKPDSVLLSDPLVYPWLQDYALAFCKSILGQARGKFATIAGPQSGTQLNGSDLMQQSQAEMEKLEQDLLMYVDGSTPLTWVTG